MWPRTKSALKLDKIQLFAIPGIGKINLISDVEQEKYVPSRRGGHHTRGRLQRGSKRFGGKTGKNVVVCLTAYYLTYKFNSFFWPFGQPSFPGKVPFIFGSKPDGIKIVFAVKQKNVLDFASKLAQKT